QTIGLHSFSHLLVELSSSATATAILDQTRAEANERAASVDAEALEEICLRRYELTCFIAYKRRAATADEKAPGGIAAARQSRWLSRRAYSCRATRESGWSLARISRRLNHPNAV